MVANRVVAHAAPRKDFRSDSWGQPVKKQSTRRTKNASKVITIALGAVVVIAGIVWILLETIFSASNTITDIQFDATDYGQYADPLLYRAIKDAIGGKNRYLTNRFGGLSKATDTVHQAFPMLDSMTITDRNAQTIKLKMTFAKPDLILAYADGVDVALYGGTGFRVQSTSSLLDAVVKVSLPDYAQSSQGLTGFFWQHSPEEFDQQMSLIAAQYPTRKGLLYLPGGDKTVLTLPTDQILYFNNAKNIQYQLEVLTKLQQGYKDRAKILTIDVWSLEGPIITLQK